MSYASSTPESRKAARNDPAGKKFDKIAWGFVIIMLIFVYIPVIIEMILK